MDCYKPTPSESTRSKISKTFAKCLHPQTPSRYPPPTQTHHNNPQTKQLKTLSEELNINIKSLKLDRTAPKLNRQRSSKPTSSGEQAVVVKQRALKEALLAKLFASVSSIKAAYAELQTAQFPYNNNAIQTSDEAIVSELMVLSMLKQKYHNNCLDLPPPHVAQLLAEIQEQQSNIKTYEITMKQMEWKVDEREKEVEGMKEKLEKIKRENKSFEKRLNSSGAVYPLANNVSLSELKATHFVKTLQYALRSVRHFVKAWVREMEVKSWDIDLAAKAIEPNAVFAKERDKNKNFVFESYVCQVMFDGFNHHSFFLPDEEVSKHGSTGRSKFFESFRKLQPMTAKQVFMENPKCPSAKYCRGKYLKLVHPKMECSFFGNLEQRKVVSSGAFPGTEFFTLFAEMARRVWLLHCLAFSFDPPAVAFQVRRGCRFSEVYMESVATVGEDDGVLSSPDVTVAFTVVPGFKIGKTVVQSQVFLSQPPRSKAVQRRSG